MLITRIAVIAVASSIVGYFVLEPTKENYGNYTLFKSGFKTREDAKRYGAFLVGSSVFLTLDLIDCMIAK